MSRFVLLQLLRKVIQKITKFRCLNNSYTSGIGIHGMNCPGDNCKILIDVHVIKELLGKDKLAELEERTIKQKFKIFECPKCNASFIIPPDFKSRVLTCVSCGESTCRLCKQPDHEGICAYRLKAMHLINFLAL